MKKMLVIAALMIGLSVQAQSADTNAPATPFAPAAPFAYGSIEAPLLSSFYSRGRLFDNREVFEPSLTVNKDMLAGTISVNAFGSLGLREPTSLGNSERYTETDLTASYTKVFNSLSVSGGYIEYIYNGQTVPNSREVFTTLSLAKPTAFLLNPTISAYYDFGTADGFYLVAGVNHPFTITKKISVVVDTSIGYGTSNYNKWYFGVDENRWNDWNSGLTLNYALTDKVTLIAGARYGIMVDEDIRQGAYDVFGAGEKWTAKLSALYSF